MVKEEYRENILIIITVVWKLKMKMTLERCVLVAEATSKVLVSCFWGTSTTWKFEGPYFLSSHPPYLLRKKKKKTYIYILEGILKFKACSIKVIFRCI